MKEQHSSKTSRWFTPPWLVQRVRRVLVDIDLDPASEEKANESVGAYSYLSMCGHRYADWELLWRRLPSERRPTTVFCNPPNGKMWRRPMPVVFWENLLRYRHEGYLKHAIFIGFNNSIMRTGQTDCELLNPSDFPHCYPRKRIAFINAETGEPDKSPTHDNVIIYVPGMVDNTAGFAGAFGDLGALVNVPKRAA